VAPIPTEPTPAQAAPSVRSAAVDLQILPWPDAVIDTLGHDPRSRYVEAFWLPTLGPTCVLLLRHLADRFDLEPDGFMLDTATTSGLLGLGVRESNNAPLKRALLRLVNFEFANHPDAETFLVRRNLPPVPTRHIRRLPTSVRATYDNWIALEQSRPPHEGIRRRARARAFMLFEQGAERDVIERWLTHTGYPPRISRDAVVWAWQRHRDAEASIDPPSTAA
jgi:hypothetical protein